MYLEANPSKSRSEQEKEETTKKYSPGEQVLPKLEISRHDSVDEEDRRIINEVRELSLREIGVRETGYEGGTRHRTGDRSRESSDQDARQHRRRDHGRRRDGEDLRPGRGYVTSSTAYDSRSQARRIEHQSSLRSLISSSDVDSSEVEEEVLRQITEEGLLDGIDLNNLDVTQEDELSERIADAYRRRHAPRPRSRDSRAGESRGSSRRTHRTHPDQPQPHQPARPPSAPERNVHSSHPPVSRPHLLEAYPTGNEQRRRTSSEHRRRTSPIPSDASTDVRRQAARSATDLTDRPQTSGGRQHQNMTNLGSGSRKTSSRDRSQASRSVTDLPRQPQNPSSRQAELSSFGRRITDPEPRLHRSRDHSQTQTTKPREDFGVSTTAHTPVTSANMPLLQTETASPTQLSPRIIHQSRTPENSPSQQAPYALEDIGPMARSSFIPPKLLSRQPLKRPELSIMCKRCSKPHLEYQLHHNCPLCEEGNYNICLRCYRKGQGCLHWYGFGNAALLRYQRQSPPAGYPSNHTFPHILIGHRYIRPALGSAPSSDGASSQMISEATSNHLQSGVFCSNCSVFANDCFWKCDVCNQGEWGFCNPCVSQGKCCTHPLLPLAHKSSKPMTHLPSTTQYSEASFATVNNSESSPDYHLPEHTFPGDGYKPLTIASKCQVCTDPIPSSTTRFHCPQCNAGDFDICAKCYFDLVSTKRISSENSHDGWRRCLEHHRMTIVGFQASSVGQKRIVVNDLVGGHALNDDALSLVAHGYTWRDGAKVQVRRSSGRQLSPSASPSMQQPHPSQKLPPDGGTGMKVSALWSYWPEEDTSSSLAFPKGAVITEAVDINGDWFWGIYAGAEGFFPSNYGRVIEVVGTPEGSVRG